MSKTIKDYAPELLVVNAGLAIVCFVWFGLVQQNKEIDKNNELRNKRHELILQIEIAKLEKILKEYKQ